VLSHRALTDPAHENLLEKISQLNFKTEDEAEKDATWAQRNELLSQMHALTNKGSSATPMEHSRVKAK